MTTTTTTAAAFGAATTAVLREPKVEIGRYQGLRSANSLALTAGGRHFTLFNASSRSSSLIRAVSTVREVLLICCHNRRDDISSLWRLRKEKDGDIFENLAVWGNEWLLQPLSYMLGDPDMILLLQDRRAIQVYNVVQQSRTEIYNDGTEEEERGGIAAIGFYDTTVSAPLQEEIVTIQTSGTKKRMNYHPVGSPKKLHKKDAVEKLKKD